ncbi:MAG TPA: hypothetical protein VML55_11995 [Planctomycetaceae bacterium]|nr:hypothetical protein [Planctomycetaceae bacterium]
MPSQSLSTRGPWTAAVALAALAATSVAPAGDRGNFAREAGGAGGRASLPVIQSFPASQPSAPAAGSKAASSNDAGSAKRDDVREVVTEHLAGLKGYEAGDLLARGDVGPLKDKLAPLSGLPEDWQEILDDFLPDNDELVRALRTPRGRAFMRKIARQPGGYDRVDRLRAMPQGMQRLRELIDAPGGEKLIEYLATTAGGKTLGAQLSKAKAGRGFNEPTGRIYTETDLLQRLEAGLKRAEAPPVADQPPTR